MARVKIVCEADALQAGLTRVLVPTVNGGLVRVWVQIKSGDRFDGTGIVYEIPVRECRLRDRLLKLGTLISYEGGKFHEEVDPDKRVEILPKGIKVLHRTNAKPVLVNELIEQMKRDMTQIGKLQTVPIRTRK
jgi:hypothetical protein